MASLLKNTAAPQSAPVDLSWHRDLRTPFVIGLIGLLALQLLLALGQSLSTPTARAGAPRMPLLDFQPEQVTAIRIEGGDSAEAVRIERRDGGAWVLGEVGDFPAAGSKADQLLTTLAALKRPLPAATSAAAQTRFKVAEHDFKRRVTLEGASGVLGTLILGETPRFKRLFGRPADDDAVYELNLALADVSQRRADWIDPAQLRVDLAQIQAVSGADWRLERDGEQWRLANAGENESLNQETAREVVHTLAALGYRDVLSEAPPHDSAAPALEITLELSDGAARTYRIAKLAESEDYVLQDGIHAQVFRLSIYDLGELVGVARSKLLVADVAAASDQPPAASE